MLYRLDSRRINPFLGEKAVLETLGEAHGVHRLFAVWSSSRCPVAGLLSKLDKSSGFDSKL